MPMPVYVSPEQIMQDREDYARKCIERGKDLVAMEYENGIVLVAENPHGTLNKISEIYDRIVFAAVGNHTEFEPLRYQGLQATEVKGYTYSREDVNAKWLANLYAQRLGLAFSQFEGKPLEVELLIAEVGEKDNFDNYLYHISFNGALWEKVDFASIGGQTDEIEEALEEEYEDDLPLEDAIRSSVKILSDISESELTADILEIVTLDRTRGRRKFKRLDFEEIAEILGETINFDEEE